jgi:hypothetical protein
MPLLIPIKYPSGHDRTIEPTLLLFFPFLFYNKRKRVPLQAWSGPEGSRKLTFPDFMKTAQDGGKVVSLTHRPPLPPGNTPGKSTPGP